MTEIKITKAQLARLQALEAAEAKRKQSEKRAWAKEKARLKNLEAFCRKHNYDPTPTAQQIDEAFKSIKSRN